MENLNKQLNETSENKKGKYYAYLGGKYVYYFDDEDNYPTGMRVEDFQDANKKAGKTLTGFCNYEEAEQFRQGSWNAYREGLNLSITTNADAVAFVDGSAVKTKAEKGEAQDVGYGVVIFFREANKFVNLSSEETYLSDQWANGAEVDASKIAIRTCLDEGCKQIEIVHDCNTINFAKQNIENVRKRLFSDYKYQLKSIEAFNNDQTSPNGTSVKIEVYNQDTEETQTLIITFIKIYSHKSPTESYPMNSREYSYSVFNDVVDVFAKIVTGISVRKSELKSLLRVTDSLDGNPNEEYKFCEISEHESYDDRRKKAEKMLTIAKERIQFIWS